MTGFCQLDFIWGNGSIGRGFLSLSLCAESSNAILDVVDGRSLAIPPFGSERLRDGIWTHWKLKNAAVACRNAFFLVPATSGKIFAAHLSWQNDPTYPGSQRRLLVWACCRIGSGKGFDASFQRLGDSWRKNRRPLVATS